MSKEERKEFSEDYVKELRNEAASWRTKYRELEASQSVVQELATRGVKADPKWVTVKTGQTPVEAVNSFLEQYPHMAPAAVTTPQTTPQTTPKPAVTTAPKPLASPAPNTENAELLQTNSLSEIRKDPTARKALREHYRSTLQAASHQKDPSDY